jgi:hypothetical protein
MLNFKIAAIGAVLSACICCGANGTSTSNTSTNANVVHEIKLDPNNLPAGLSATPLAINANNMPAGITIDGAPPPPGRKPTPGIRSAEELKKGVKPTSRSTPGIPDAETLRKQLGYPPANAAPRGETMMKSNRKLGGRPQ